MITSLLEYLRKLVKETEIGTRFSFTKYILGTPSQAKITGAEMTDDGAKIILKWRLESYSPISDCKVNSVCFKCTKNIFSKFNATDAKHNLFFCSCNTVTRVMKSGPLSTPKSRTV